MSTQEANISSYLDIAEEDLDFLANKIIKVCKRLYKKNLLAAADGNISCRVGHRILITPSGVHKGFLKKEQLAVLDLESGEALLGTPSSEKLMHLEVYKKCDKAKAVIHAHPPTAVAWSIARPRLQELPSESLSEVILAVGHIPFVPYARPGTLQMAEVLAPYLPDRRTMILSRHGALCWGESLEEAFNGMERIESSAHMLFLAEQLGGITNLPDEEVANLKELRKKLGERSL